MRNRPSITVLNTPCVLTHKVELARELAEWCSSPDGNGPLSVDFTNVHITAMRTVDPAFFKTTSSVDWFVPDSQILTVAARLLGGTNHSRAYGPDFMDHFFRHGDTSVTHYLLGASQECLDALKSKLQQIQPGCRIVGTHNGYFDATREPAISADINRCNPDLVWVGLGTPKQQEWIDRNKHLLDCRAILAVGFAFDVIAGTKKDAPAWIGRIGLLWLHRLLSEPRRLWKRYLVYNSIFLYKFALQYFSRALSQAPGNNNPAIS